MSENYLETLTANQILWGFFSGATRDSAEYVLQQRLGLRSPVLTAMEDAPGKPDPTGLLATVEQLYPGELLPVFYAGDTVADMQTVAKAKIAQPERAWFAIGILPPHVNSSERAERYSTRLKEAGAITVLSHVEQLSVTMIQEFSSNISD
jgi:HAD superfamily phosphatase